MLRFTCARMDTLDEFCTIDSWDSATLAVRFQVRVLCQQSEPLRVGTLWCSPTSVVTMDRGCEYVLETATDMIEWQLARTIVVLEAELVDVPH